MSGIWCSAAVYCILTIVTAASGSGAWLQRLQTRELEATLERVQGELSAQGLALEAMAADREAAHMAASETADRIKVWQTHLPAVLAAAQRCNAMAAPDTLHRRVLRPHRNHSTVPQGLCP